VGLSDLADGPRRARILTTDIETAPHLGYFFDPKTRYITPDKMVQRGGATSLAAKWLGEPNVAFHSVHADGYEDMVREAHRLLSEADIVVSYNGDRFDFRKLNTEFVRLGMGRPRPFRSVDLIKVVRSNFAFPYNRLDEVCRELGLPTKVAHQGFRLWTACMAGDDAAWRTMARYNRGDVRITERLYLRLLPWISSHPNLNLWAKSDGSCPNCLCKKLEQDGSTFTPQTEYALFRCTRCGVWLRNNFIRNRSLVRGVR
jgi:DNA polymerase elongation subunit (family B)